MSIEFKEQIATLKLELLRSGPSHNQLLSPLTAYIALCGNDGPVTVYIPLEHRQLLARISRLRYEEDFSDTTKKTKQRHSEIREIGEIMGSIFSQIPSLVSELGVASTRNNTMVHLRLVLMGSELSMLPFEAAISMKGFPGSGSPLFLQHHIPISITREVRREHKPNLQWNRSPKILFAFAAPNGLFVPAQEHLQAIREAIEPWIKIYSKGKEEERRNAVKEILTVLPDASLDKIRRYCEEEEYTHIHILAHGAQDNEDSEERFGIALCNDLNPEIIEIIDGRRLGMVLTVRDSFGAAHFHPTVVTLATCDSANISSVIAPGGSIAHELHECGIPWVIASQFPLWMKGSAIVTDVFYRGVLRGDDPRWVLYKIRQLLHLNSPETHDWASIVAYSTLTQDFEDQVRFFRNRQIRQKFEIKLTRIDELVCYTAKFDREIKNELNKLNLELENDYSKWKDEIDRSNSPDKAVNLAMCAMVHIRLGVAYHSLINNIIEHDSNNLEEINQYEREKMRVYKMGCDLYSESLDIDPCNDSVTTQFLLITSIISTPDILSSKNMKDKWIVARQVSLWNSAKLSGNEKIRNFGVLAELALLGFIYRDNDEKLNNELEIELNDYCDQITQLSKTDNTELLSIRQQLKRYRLYWKKNEWSKQVEDALEKLRE